MTHKLNAFVLKDTPVWNIEEDFIILSDLLRRGGVLFWCRYGEWRAIGGPQLQIIVEHLKRHADLRQAYVIADLTWMAPDQAYAYDEWDAAIPVPAELVHWLREDVQQLGKADTSTDASAE